MNDVTDELIYSEFDISIRQYNFLNCVQDPKSLFQKRREHYPFDARDYLENPKKIQRHIIHALYYKPLDNDIHYSNYLNDMGPLEFNRVRGDIMDFVETFKVAYKQIESDLHKITAN